MTMEPSESLLTLEPLIDAVRSGVESAGWTLSGLQKTTSHQFEGRWAGDSTRSAYLFFHRDEADDVSIDVFLDETGRGLSGNLALVVDGRRLGLLGDVTDVVGTLAAISEEKLPEGYTTPLTVRFRLADRGEEAASADSEARFKLSIPRSAIRAGASAVEALSSVTARAFGDVLGHPRLASFQDA